MPEMDFHLLHPQAFWLLLVLPAVIFMIWRRVRSSASWSRVIDPHLLPHLMTGTGETRTSRNHWWTVIWLALAVLAIAGPSFSKIDVPVFQRADALVIVLDLSASMAAADIQPSRVQRAKQKIMDLLAERDEGVTGLVVYAGDAHVVAPLTDDRRTIENLLTALSPDIMPLPGSNPTEALERALSLLQTAGAASGQILLMTDGMPKFEPALIADQLDAAIDIAILGIGTGTGAPIPRSDGGFLRNDNGDIVIPGLDAAALQAHATALGGRFSRISLDNSDIDSLLTIPGSMDSGEIALDRETDAWLDQGNWIALLLALVLLPLFRRGAMAALLIMPLMTPGTARAQTLDFLWQTPDQQAATVLEAGDPATAATLFENPAWRGTANYGAGNWNDAAEDFKETDDPDNWYNQGNALAKAGDLQGALEAYDRTLAAQPDAEDA
ncbi:MAG: VWA domain-containing protein, partial [Luminiphilus sp.]